MKILVTGGGGFLGSAISHLLLQRGALPLAFQRSANPDLASAGAQVIQGDLRDAGALTRASEGCDAVIHVAGKAGAWGAYEDYYGINVEGTENVIQACRQNGIARLVYTSSPSVAHGGGDIEGADESLPYPEHFSAPYPATKALAEQRVAAANGEELATVSLRPHLIWGPGDQQLLPRLMERAGQGPIRLPGADKLIDTVYVENAAQAHVLALDALDTNPDCRGSAYFISNGEPLPQREIMAALLDAAGIKADIRTISPWLARAAGTVFELAWKAAGKDSEPPITRWSAEQLSTAHWYDISAARRDLGYLPTITIQQGLERLRDWFAQQP